MCRTWKKCSSSVFFFLLCPPSFQVYVSSIYRQWLAPRVDDRHKKRRQSMKVLLQRNRMMTTQPRMQKLRPRVKVLLDREMTDLASQSPSERTSFMTFREPKNPHIIQSLNQQKTRLLHMVSNSSFFYHMLSWRQLACGVPVGSQPQRRSLFRCSDICASPCVAVSIKFLNLASVAVGDQVTWSMISNPDDFHFRYATYIVVKGLFAKIQPVYNCLSALITKTSKYS